MEEKCQSLTHTHTRTRNCSLTHSLCTKIGWSRSTICDTFLLAYLEQRLPVSMSVSIWALNRFLCRMSFIPPSRILRSWVSRSECEWIIELNADRLSMTSVANLGSHNENSQNSDINGIVTSVKMIRHSCWHHRIMIPLLGLHCHKIHSTSIMTSIVTSASTFSIQSKDFDSETINNDIEYAWAISCLFWKYLFNCIFTPMCIDTNRKKERKIKHENIKKKVNGWMFKSRERHKGKRNHISV